jgi:hypothetical protein
MTGLFQIAGLAAVVAVVNVAEPPFKEHELRRTYLSGEEVMGLVGGDFAKGRVGSTLTISGVRNADPYLCVRLHSASGLYEAEILGMPNPKRGPTLALKLPSSKLSRMTALGGEIAIQAWASPNPVCQAQPDVLLPAAWGSAAPGSSLILLVNGRDATRGRTQFGDGALQRCAPIGALLNKMGLGARVYDRGCPILLPPQCGAESVVNLRLFDVEAERPPIAIRVRSPC